MRWFQKRQSEGTLESPIAVPLDDVLTGGAQPVSRRQVPLEIHDSLRSWDRIATSLRIIFVTLGCVATVSAIVATTFNEQMGIFWTKVCICSAAVAVGLLTAFDISGKANAIRRACRNLRAAIMLYNWEATFTISDLMSDYRRDQDLVGDV
ncbi:MAG: hypothetical protein ACRD3J_02580, partial [Thermoanaerobaculia bacterium]